MRVARTSIERSLTLTRLSSQTPESRKVAMAAGIRAVTRVIDLPRHVVIDLSTGRA
jgi:hypothetical protein